MAGVQLLHADHGSRSDAQRWFLEFTAYPQLRCRTHCHLASLRAVTSADRRLQLRSGEDSPTDRNAGNPTVTAGRAEGSGSVEQLANISLRTRPAGFSDLGKRIARTTRLPADRRRMTRCLASAPH